MKLSELIQHVGDENVLLQNLEHDMTKVSGPYITFGTSRQNAEDLKYSGITGVKPRKIGIVVWIPRDLMPAELD